MLDFKFNTNSGNTPINFSQALPLKVNFSYGNYAQVSGSGKDGLHRGNLCSAWQYIRNIANSLFFSAL